MSDRVFTFLFGGQERYGRCNKPWEKFEQSWGDRSFYSPSPERPDVEVVRRQIASNTDR